MRLFSVIALAAAARLSAQEAHVMAQAIGLVTRADPTAGKRTLTEAYLAQPVIMGGASWSRWRAAGTLNLEGLTLDRGELATGGYGEGYVDRRHPHAYVHELLVGVQDSIGGLGVSFFAGRGFAPFGSDDPMMRPLEKYPVNHHLAQILERLVAVAAVRRGPVIGEVATFGGDEPTGPGAPPNVHRFGDSWAARLTALPAAGAEVSASVAGVKSPEERSGHGLDQVKTSLVARFSRNSGGDSQYALAEWAHTDERVRSQTVTRLTSLLAEGQVCRAGVSLAVRAERTDRPEEERLLDPFRTPRPPHDLSNIGVSRWMTYTATLAAPAVDVTSARVAPFVEIARVHVTAGNPVGVFDPLFVYGARRMWMLSGGARVRVGMRHDRMGRYGVALPSGESHATMGTAMHHHGSDMDSPAHSSASRCAL